MGKYSTPATFSGSKKTKLEGKKYAPIDWGKEVDERIDVAQAMWEHAGVDLQQFKGSRRQLNAKCPYPGCTSTEDSFMVWPHRSPRTGNHYHCRKCDRSGDLIQLLEDINGWTFEETLIKLGLKDSDARSHKARGETQADRQQREYEEWARAQLIMLRHLYPRMKAALARFELPQAYLAQRGVSLEQAQYYGLGYIAYGSEVDRDVVDEQLRRWEGRLIFPLTSPASEEITFAGRTLALWQPGMSPYEHKKAIDVYNQQFEKRDNRRIIRVLKTSPCGHFGYKEATANSRPQLIFPEGEFDALSLLLSGIEGVIAMGTGFSTDLIPLSVESVVLAMDADAPGQQAARKLALTLASVGLDVQHVLPSEGKDWNDMFVTGSADTIYHLFQAKQVGEQSSPITDNQAQASIEADTFSSTCTICGAEPEHYCNAGVAYCGQHWPYEGREPVEYGVSVCCVCGAQAEHAGPLGSTYCTEHYLCIRGHVIRWRKDEISDSWSCACQWEEQPSTVSYIQPVQRTVPQQPMTEEQFMAIVQRIAAVFPGGCSVHRDPPGYTIADRARELPVTSSESRGDYWASNEAKMLRPPENSFHKPFYTREAWLKKYHKLKNWRPDENAYAHLPGGYAGYCQMYQPRQETAAETNEKLERANTLLETFPKASPQPTIAKRRKGRTVPSHTTKPAIQAGPEDIEALCQKHQFKIGESCEKCGCPVQYERPDYTCCVRCYPYPLRGDDDYSGIIDAVYPRLPNREQATRKA